MRRAYLVLPAAAVVLTACSSGLQSTASHQAQPSAAAPSPNPSPSPGASALIADTAMDVATCHQFAAEQAGQLNADQFNAWLLENGGQTTIGPPSASGLDNTLTTNLGDWYVVHATEPSGDLQPASYYAAEVRAECLSIGA
jgi:uncharacterized lipoprotein YmbA